MRLLSATFPCRFEDLNLHPPHPTPTHCREGQLEYNTVLEIPCIRPHSSSGNVLPPTPIITSYTVVELGSWGVLDM